MAKILFVVSGATYLVLKDGTRWATGYWAEEFANPYKALTDAGHEVVVATPGGTTPNVDMMSLRPAMTGGEQAALDLEAVIRSAEAMRRPLQLSDARLGDYDAVYLPGGHGPMQDLAVDPDVARILARLLPDPTKVVASLCHGPASFFSAGNPDGSWPFKGRRLTAFTDEKEQQAGLAANATWLLEQRLRGAGAEFESGPAWGPYVVVDGNLITGQNPASGEAAAEAMLTALAAHA